MGVPVSLFTCVLSLRQIHTIAAVKNNGVIGVCHERAHLSSICRAIHLAIFREWARPAIKLPWTCAGAARVLRRNRIKEEMHMLAGQYLSVSKSLIVHHIVAHPIDGDVVDPHK